MAVSNACILYDITEIVFRGTVYPVSKRDFAAYEDFHHIIVDDNIHRHRVAGCEFKRLFGNSHAVGTGVRGAGNSLTGLLPERIHSHGETVKRHTLIRALKPKLRTNGSVAVAFQPPRSNDAAWNADVSD